MKYFLDSAKMDEIKEAYEYLGIDGVTTNPKHIMNSGKPFRKAIEDIAKWTEDQGFKSWKDFPVSVEIDPWLEDCDKILPMAREISSVSFPASCAPCAKAFASASELLFKRGLVDMISTFFMFSS